jgi:hypothetical protein
VIGRPLFQQPIFARQNERYVNSERELLAALNDIATGVNRTSAGVKSIVVGQNIQLKNTITLTSVHNGTTIRGLSRETTITSAQGSTLSSIFNIVSGAYFYFEKLTISNAASGGAAIRANSALLTLSVAECLLRANSPLDVTADTLNVDRSSFNAADFSSGSVALQVEVVLGSLANCSCFAGLTLSSTSFFRVTGNVFTNDIVLSNACTGVVIMGNVMVSGDINTSLGGGSAVIVGNHMFGNTITSAGGDTVASNHA